MTDIAFAPLEMPTVSATDQVFQMVYNAVISLKLPPGTKVSESEVARQLQVSRQPVRDAFFRLSDLGFLSIKPQRATRITLISEQAVLNAVFTRTAIEVECLRCAIAKLDEGHVAQLRANLAKMTSELDTPDVAAFHAHDDEFHALLCDIAGQPHAWALIQEQKAHMDRVRYLTLSVERRQQVLSEHTVLIEAIIARDAQASEASLRDHIGDVGDVLKEIRKQYPDYFEPRANAG
jgi:DNA-binding GntR family transcriptional regulator